MLVRLIGLAVAWLAASDSLVYAHGSHSSQQDPSGDWATWHMQGESSCVHYLDNSETGKLIFV